MIKVHLSRIMGEQKLKISDVANMTGLHRNGLTRLYNEDLNGIQWKTLEALCKALKCSVGELIEYVDETE